MVALYKGPYADVPGVKLLAALVAKAQRDILAILVVEDGRITIPPGAPLLAPETQEMYLALSQRLKENEQ